MTTITTYDKSGRFMNIVECSESSLELYDKYLDGGIDGNLYYFLSGQATPRPPMPASIDKATIKANSQEIAVITGPPGATLTVSGPIGAQEIMDEDGIAFSTGYPGRYTLKMELFPFLDWEATLEAT